MGLSFLALAQMPGLMAASGGAVRGTPGKVVGIELHAPEPPVDGRTSIASDGVVVLRYMPKAV